MRFFVINVAKHMKQKNLLQQIYANRQPSSQK